MNGGELVGTMRKNKRLRLRLMSISVLEGLAKAGRANPDVEPLYAGPK